MSSRRAPSPTSHASDGPAEQAPWGDSFGMLIDKFGVSWLVDIAGAQP